MCVSVRGYVHMRADAHRGQMRAIESWKPELTGSRELPECASNQTWVLYERSKCS